MKKHGKIKYVTETSLSKCVARTMKPFSFMLNCRLRGHFLNHSFGVHAQEIQSWPLWVLQIIPKATKNNLHSLLSSGVIRNQAMVSCKGHTQIMESSRTKQICIY